MYPIKAEHSEENKIIIFAWLIYSDCVSGLKASKVIKIDIVNPIPPRKPMPNICFQLVSKGSLHSFKILAK